MYSKKDRDIFIELFRRNATNVSKTCDAMNIVRDTFYKWYNEHEDFKKSIDAAREEMCDFGESQLFQLMKGIPKLDEAGKHIGWIVEPNPAAVIFFNKTRNKNRGYDERHIFKPDDDWTGEISINVTKPEHAKKLKDFIKKHNGG